MINKIKNKSITIYVALNILFVFISSILCTIHIMDQELYGNLLILPFLFNILISLLLFWYFKIKKKTYKFNIIDIILLIMIICGIISAIFAIDFEYAIRGTPTRYEGLVAILYYLTLFYVTSFMDKKDRKKIVYLIVFTGVCQAVYGFLQIIESPLVEVIKRGEETWATGFTMNPNFFGTYMVLCISASLGLFVEEKGIIKRIILGVAILLLTVGLLISNAMSALVALLAVLITLLVYCIMNKKIKELIVPIVIISSLFIILTGFGLTRLYGDAKKTTSEAVEISKGNIQGSYGTKRLEIWKESIKIVPKYLVHGAGIDNFIFAFGEEPLTINGTYFDKAHNELLHVLITEGLLAFIAYSSFYLIIVIKGIKLTFKGKEIYLLLPVIGYLTQAMFNISVVEVAPIFFISLGLLYNRKAMNLS